MVVRIIESAGSNRVPVFLPLNDEDQESQLHGGMDNFGHDEATSYGLGGSHDNNVISKQRQNR